MSAILRYEHQRNTYYDSSISKIPREVLSLVFLEVRNDAMASKTHDIRSQALNIHAWVIVAHVCHAWKAIALSNSELWSTIFVTPEVYKWAEEFLHRSHEKSLDIYIAMQHRRFTGAPQDAAKKREAVIVFLEKTLSRHMGRCRSIYQCELPPTTVSRLLASTKESSLRCINFTFDRRSAFNEPTAAPFLLDSTRPSLRSLTKLAVTHCTFRYQIGDLLNLTHLELRDLVDSDAQALFPSCRHLLKALAPIRNLRRLVLNRVFAQIDDESSPPRNINLVNPTKVQFRALEHVKIVGTTGQVDEILANIIIPQPCHLSIQPRRVIDNFAVERIAFDSILQSIPTCRSPLIVPHSELQNPPKSAWITLKPRTHHFKLQLCLEDSPAGHHTTIFSFSYRPVKFFETATISPLLALMDLSQITSLNIVGQSESRGYGPLNSRWDVDVRQYLDLLVNDFEDPQHLERAPNCTCEDAHTSGHPCTWTPRFPSLQKIEIGRTDNNYTFVLDQAFLERMRSALRRRLKHGLPELQLRLPYEFNAALSIKLGGLVEDRVFIESFDRAT